MADFEGYVPPWRRQSTWAQLRAYRPASLFRASEEYLTSEDENADEAQDFQWWDGPEDPDEDFTESIVVDSGEPEVQLGAGSIDQRNPSSPSSETEAHACPTCGRAYQEALSGAPQPGPGSPLVDRVLRVIQAIANEGLTLGRFLAALSWGDPACVSNERIKNVRASFMGSSQLPDLLRTWWKPLRSLNSHKSRPRGAHSIMEAFAKEVVEVIAHEELGAIDPLLRASDDHLSKEDLLKTDFDLLEGEMRTCAPTIWSLLSNLCKTPQQLKDNMVKDTGKRVLSMLSTLTYTRSRLCNRIQRVLDIYFKFKVEAMAEVQRLVQTHTSFLSYDNVYMTFRIFSQRLEKNGAQTAGTAATVYVKKDTPMLDPAVNCELQESRRAGMQDPITPLQIADLAIESAPAIHKMKVFHVLEVLLESREFNAPSYPHKNSAILFPPPPVNELPCGPNHVALQFMLGTLATPEATYKDNDKVISELLKQVGCSSLADFRKLSLERILFIIGDQLTVERIRGLQYLLCQEFNSHERLDFVLPIFGWFHFEMAFAKSLHKQYLGTNAGMVLKHAFTVLDRKGLDKRVTQGPFHDNLERALYDILEAHLRLSWITVSGVSRLEELRSRTPEELHVLAERIVVKHGSTDAMTELKEQPGEVDEVRMQTTMFVRDVLLYVVLHRAIKHGDVGLMEGILPHTLFRFAGGQNPKYTTECLELLQGLHKEWPPWADY
ncbi:hypothetical protein LXA43DRAFT_1104951 [Ganoderma leucocontextum]|nr:hypothetical protein LXA43DRAFT_1104951 [Ganoderma leucocontextum]